MLNIIVYTKDIRIHDVDYLIEDTDKFVALLPYLTKKIQGDWIVALFMPDIQFVRELLTTSMIPEHVQVDCYLEKSVANQVLVEHPNLAIQVKTAYEKYLDLIADLKVMIAPKAAKELYRRVGQNKDKLPEYLYSLANNASNGVITEYMVRSTVIDERRTYASEVVEAFLLRERWRWKKYNDLIEDLGNEYAFYSMRKYISKLLKEKSNYLRNEDTTLRNINRIDSFSINRAYVIFNTMSYKELPTCMYLLEHRESMRRFL